jgi:hypothetical protein
LIFIFNLALQSKFCLYVLFQIWSLFFFIFFLLLNWLFFQISPFNQRSSLFCISILIFILLFTFFFCLKSVYIIEILSSISSYNI